MKIIEYLSAIATTMTEPKMIAESRADLFDQLANNSDTIRAQIMLGGDQNLITSVVSVQPSATEEEEVLMPTLTLKETFDIIKLELADTNISEVNVTRTLQDVNGINHDIDFSYIFEDMARKADSLRVTAMSYSSLVTEGINSATDFINKLSLAIINKTENVTKLGGKLFDLLQSTEDLGEKLRSIDDFVGVTQAIESPGQALSSEVIGLGNYTGINPVIAWYNGLNINITNILTAIAGVGIVIGKALTSAANYLGGLLDKSVTNVINYFNHTIINPVDVNVDGDFCEFFKIPGKTTYLINSNEGVGKSGKIFLSILDLHQNLHSNKVWFRYAGSIFQSRLENTSTSGVYRAWVERYIKPISPIAVATIASKFSIKKYDAIEAEGSVRDFNLGQALAFLNSLSESDLSLKSDASEEEISAGLKLALKFEYLYEEMLGGSANLINFARTYVEDPYLLNWSIDLSEKPTDMYFTSELGYANIISNTFINIMQGVSMIADNARLAAGNWQTCNSVIYYSAPTVTLGNLINEDDINVTNIDFIKLVTSFGKYSYDDNYNNLNNGYYEAIDNGYNDSLFSILSYLFSVTEAYKQHYPNNQIPISVAYMRKSNYKFNCNIGIKTDSQNVQAFENLLIGVVIIAAVVIVAAVTIKAILSFKRFAYNTMAAYYAAEFAYGEKIIDGTATMFDYNQVRKYRILNSILNGASNASAFTTSSVITSLTPDSEKLDLALKLLK